ncbi:hypothetical protein D3C71_1967850 [compost metagenome]
MRDGPAFVREELHCRLLYILWRERGKNLQFFIHQAGIQTNDRPSTDGSCPLCKGAACSDLPSQQAELEPLQ